MKKAFDDSKAANQFCLAAVISFSLLSSLWPSFSLAWLCSSLWNVLPDLEKLQELLRLLRDPTNYHKILGSDVPDVKKYS